MHNLWHHLVRVFALTFSFVSLNFAFALVLKRNEHGDHPLYRCYLLVIGTGNAYFMEKKVEARNLAENMQAGRLLKCLLGDEDKTANVC